jgi:hypothetical protein
MSGMFPPGGGKVMDFFKNPYSDIEERLTTLARNKRVQDLTFQDLENAVKLIDPEGRRLREIVLLTMLNKMTVAQFDVVIKFTEELQKIDNQTYPLPEVK